MIEAPINLNQLLLSEKMLSAIKYAAQAHEGQMRRGGGPFFSHPVAVGLALANAGFVERVVVAGILHDTIEDTETTYADLGVAFGQDVAELVRHVSYDQDLPPDEGKETYLNQLAVAPLEARAISAADLLANRTDTLLALRAEGDISKRPANLEKTIDYDRRRKIIDSN